MLDVFDLVVPTAAAASIMLSTLAPFYMPRVFVVFLFCYLSYFAFMTTTQLAQYIASVRRIVGNIRKNAGRVGPRPEESKAEKGETALAALETGVTSVVVSNVHVFIIPNYCESFSILQKTLEKLSAHSSASTNYVAVLAMEATEVNSREKAQTLVSEYQTSFRDILIAVHPADMPGEARGKGSNVNYAARQACSILTGQGIPMKQMILTIMDADATIPELYVDSLERAMLKAENPYNTLFCPPMFFGKNSLHVPAPVRCTDILWSVIVTQNLSNSRELAFPCAVYSLTMVLADKVDYWDSDFDSIAEDFHMRLKCFYKTEARAMSIDVPINLTNVQSTGYYSTLWARFTQAQRHGLGCADFGYALRKSINTPETSTLSNIRDRIFVGFLTVEAFVIPPTSGWVLTVGGFMFNMFIRTSDFAGEPLIVAMIYAVAVLAALAPLPLLICCVVYEFYHRVVEKTLYRKGGTLEMDSKNNEAPVAERSIKNVLDYLSLPLSALLFVTIPATISAFQRLVPSHGLTYVTSEKHIDESVLKNG